MVMSGEQQSTVSNSGQTSTVSSSENLQQETVSIEEPVVEELTVGSDGNELFVDTALNTLDIWHNDKKWTFTYKKLSWAEKYKCVDAAQIWNEGEFSFSLSLYYTMSLIAMIMDSPIKPFTETTLARLDSGVVAQLLTIVPPPADPEIPEAAKKALGLVETG